MRLYHLLSTRFGLDDLKHRQLKIAQISDLNDPFELVAADNSDAIQRQILRGWRREFERKWGVLCFSKSWRNPLLWSHYADKHKGMCLGFDISAEYLLPIRYQSKRIQVDLVQSYDQGSLNVKFMNRMLRTKFRDWSYEKEVRVPVELKEIDEKTGLYFYNFSTDLRLKEIIVGPLCSASESDIQNALSNDDLSVKVVKARLAFQSFTVVKNRKGFGDSVGT